MKITTLIAVVLTVVGALNWLLIGLFAFDLVAFLFGAMSVLTRIVYSLVGISALWMIFIAFVYKPFQKIAA